MIRRQLSSAPADDVEQRIERLSAICFILNARVAELEASNAELRARLNLDPPRLAISATCKTVKQVAAATGYSKSHIYNLIIQEKIAAWKTGGSI
jgi:hypothetical protein